MLSIGFWNIADALAGLDPVVGWAVSVANDPSLSGQSGECLLGLAETGGLHPLALLAALKSVDSRPWWVTKPNLSRFIILGTVPENHVQFHPEVSSSLPCTVYRTGSKGVSQTEVCYVHLASPIGDWDPKAFVVQTAMELRLAVEDHESKVSNGRTVLIGDFNMLPYDSGMVSPTGLHASPCQYATAKTRKMRKQAVQYFYNPMWELMGNWSPTRQPGTFYKRNLTDSIRWHMIDQVLVRPAIAQLLNGSPRVLTIAGKNSLVSRNGVIVKKISDHLPVVVSLLI